jgi:uncharacterized protein YndB with AHSA1/START domain
MYGSYATIEDTPTLTFERRLSHPVDRVWRAITEPDDLQHWFPSKVVADELRAGAEMTFEFEDMPLDAPSSMGGSVTDFEPPRLFAFYWGEDHLRFELEPADDPEACMDRLESRLGEDGAGAEWRDYYDEYQRRGVPAGAPIPGD